LSYFYVLFILYSPQFIKFYSAQNDELMQHWPS